LKSDPINSEDGSVEAGLTFIPTTAFFLLVIQLVISGSFQVFETMNLQSLVTKVALGEESELVRNGWTENGSTGDGLTGDGLTGNGLTGNGVDSGIEYTKESLPGGGEVILVNSKISTPQISNLLGGKVVMKAQAMAISE
jgi:hypothetical protein